MQLMPLPYFSCGSLFCTFKLWKVLNLYKVHLPIFLTITVQLIWYCCNKRKCWFINNIFNWLQYWLYFIQCLAFSCLWFLLGVGTCRTRRCLSQRCVAAVDYLLGVRVEVQGWGWYHLKDDAGGTCKNYSWASRKVIIDCPGNWRLSVSNICNNTNNPAMTFELYWWFEGKIYCKIKTKVQLYLIAYILKF